MYTAVIVDDMQLNSAYLQKALSNYNEFDVIETALTAEIGEALIMKLHPDILFLDIILDNQNGFDVYKKIKKDINWDMLVVVYSSHDEYAIEAFKYMVFAFLKKPLILNELDEIMQRFFEIKEIKGTNHKEDLELLLKKQIKCTIATNTGFEFIYLDTIIYFEYDNISCSEQWFAILINKKRFPLKRNTKAQTILDYSIHFRQINNHQIINMFFLARILTGKCVFYAPFESYSKDMIVSRKYLKPLQQELLKI